MKNVIVTGGAGFLGSHLVARLVADHRVAKVIVVDNLLTGSRSNLEGLDSGKLHLVEMDVIDLTKNVLQAVMDSLDVTVVHQIYHLACPASPLHYARDPVHTTKSAVMGTLNMLEAATLLDATLLVTSTSEVYGDPELSPQKESYNGNVVVNGPRSCYDEGKRCAESLCFDFVRMHQTKVKVARLFNTYGPNMAENDGRVVSNFIVQSLNGVPLTIYGDGSQTRSFCYVDDMIDALLKFMVTPNAVTGPINLGNPKEQTIAEIAETVRRLAGGKKISYTNLPVDDPKQRCPDITKAIELLDWRPAIGIEEGLRNTIEYFKQKLELV